MKKEKKSMMSLRRGRRSSVFAAVLLLPVLLCIGSKGFSEEMDCLMCHADLANKKNKHAAIDMGCTSCHSQVDASDIPHKIKNKINKGLSSEQPELCFGCHDNTLFTGKTVHAALSMGCTFCHNPHSSEREKLLASETTGLCFSCHDKEEFSKKTIHAPVAGGMCLACHGPHASDNIALLRKKPIDVCLDCHGDVEKKPHAIGGFANAGHPIGKKEKKDPKRPERIFYCGSCHNPHSSTSGKLFRYEAASTMGICKNCHTY